MVTGSLAVELILVKFHQRLIVHPSLAWKKADVFKTNGRDDDDDKTFSLYIYAIYIIYAII